MAVLICEWGRLHPGGECMCCKICGQEWGH